MDTKILRKILAKQNQLGMKALMGHDQGTFIPGMWIGFDARKSVNIRYRINRLTEKSHRMISEEIGRDVY